jgi:hypothetical protein
VLAGTGFSGRIRENGLPVQIQAVGNDRVWYLNMSEMPGGVTIPGERRRLYPSNGSGASRDILYICGKRNEGDGQTNPAGNGRRSQQLNSSKKPIISAAILVYDKTTTRRRVLKDASGVSKFTSFSYREDS